MSTFDALRADMGNIPSSTESIAREVFEWANSDQERVWHLWGMGDSSEHASGLAIDFMVKSTEAGNVVRDYLWANRNRLRLKHVIWNQHITSVVVSPGIVRPMDDRGSVTENHMDHVHAFFYAGDYQPVDAPRPPVTPPPPLPTPELLDVDGKLGPKTIKRWQEIMRSPADGVIDHPSELVRQVQRHLNMHGAGLNVDGWGIEQDGNVYKTVRALQNYLGTKVDGVMSSPVSTVVKAIQTRLNMGWF